MHVIHHGNLVDIYQDDVKCYDDLSNNTYRIICDKMTGFHLMVVPDIISKEPKVYGVHDVKLSKISKAFEITNRNLGVILSGDKGIGKSLFARMLCEKEQEIGYPVIICDRYYPGIANFIDSISQECIILFDEFDKTFKSSRDESPQDEMLSLFDGVNNGKKLFIVTCNSLQGLDDCLINRPGRFHYHLRFSYPNVEEVRQYLEDSVNSDYHGEIDKVVKFSTKIDLNYDCLRAIAFDLNLGDSFESAIRDLNIVNFGEQEYIVEIELSNGIRLTKCHQFDMFEKDEEDKNIRITFDKKIGNLVDGFAIGFNVNDIEYDISGKHFVNPDDVIIARNEWSDELTEDQAKYFSSIKINHLYIYPNRRNYLNFY